MVLEAKKTLKIRPNLTIKIGESDLMQDENKILITKKQEILWAKSLKVVRR
ncbi:hypothetical protein [Candidatus Mycoplasma haematohominis]|uniref:hypothetical protein n=1 Tax=Candidatus Mycoplasma haematohominis TaxID=1494318 RepID=UPI001C0A6C17|nr:hypothetical protein [Candidatus Mycoplasma haemohominis]